MKRSLLLSMVLALVLFSGGCNFFGDSGSSSSSLTPTPEPTPDPTPDPSPSGSASGNFVDSPVANLSYTNVPSGIFGITDSDGKFEYDEGDTITFSLGGIVLGSAPASRYLTPNSLFPGNEEQALNVAQFLQSIDSNGDPSDGITPDEGALEALKEIDFAAVDFQQRLQANLPGGLAFVERDAAREHMEDTFNDLAINPNGTVQSTEILFSGYDAQHGYELWKTKDGRTLEFIKDLNDGDERAYPEEFTKVGSYFYFIAETGSGDGLWKSDGTEAGTTLLKVFTNDINSLAALDDNTLLFRGYDSEHGYELWKSDGTAAGTVMVKDILTGTGNSYPYGFTSYKGKSSLFSVTSNGRYYAVTDGTASGTAILENTNTTPLNGLENYMQFVKAENGYVLVD